MPRYYRRRYRTIVRAPKKKWGSNLIAVDMSVVNPSGSTADRGYHVITLAANKTETNAPTPVVIKTGNFKLQADYWTINQSTTLPTGPEVKCFIVFVPQGMEPTNYASAAGLINNHPEWIMAWKVVDSGSVNANTSVDFNKFSMSSRLKRNLNSGDSVMCLLLVEGISPQTTVSVKGLCQFWTCAN